MKIVPETWKQVEPLFAEALELPEAERLAWLAGMRATHPAIAPLLETLVAQAERAERALEMETVPKLAPAPAASSAFAPGERVGPFRLLRPLGRGGMGEVWLAEQADGRVTREVALKLPILVEAGGARAERFGRERDILARLEHPHIARLYDAGVGERGQPWLAMEHVQGEPLDAYVAAGGLAIPERLALFRQVLAAVAHAHRHLVVHRDLKPANILVDREGQVKLLDFGIAKLLEDHAGAGDRDLTRLGGRLMTLRYAAPEQVEGGEITTATDIYSLGVVLHEILTGASPYRAVREGRAFTEAALLGEEIALPSSAARHARVAPALRGDLDAILLKALRRDPGARYATVELMDDDIARHLGRRPVAARAGTWRYLAGRFAQRHRLTLTMGAAVVVAMGVGLVVAERERRDAVAERARAERHLASVRKLANTFIFDVHAQIESLPGSLKAREMLVKTSLDYLDALSAEMGNDPALVREVAEAYRRIGDVQGQVRGMNAGSMAAGLGNYEKSKRLFVALDAVKADDIETVRGHASLSYALARAYVQVTDPRWHGEIATTVRLRERAAALPGATAVDRAEVPFTIAERANLTDIMAGPSPEIEAAVVEAVATLEALSRELPGEQGVRDKLIATYKRAANVLSGSHRTPRSIRQAIDYRRKSMEMIQAALERRPDDYRMGKLALDEYVGLGVTLSLAGDNRAADEALAQAMKLGAERHARDPANAETLLDNLTVLEQASLVAYQLGDHPRAIARGREALAMAARMPEDARKSLDVRFYVAEAKFHTGAALVAGARAASPDRAGRLARLREARALLSEALGFLVETRAAKLRIFHDGEEEEMRETLARCDEAIARLAS